MSRRHRVRVESVALGRHDLTPEQTRYLRRVLRSNPGDSVELFDGRGQRGVGVLLEGPAVDVEHVEQEEAPLLALTIAAATPKGERADWLVEKVAELGATELQWLSCRRSVVKPEAGSKKLERFRRIADSAARQSQQSWTLSVLEPIALETFLARGFDHAWIAHPGAPQLRASTIEGCAAVLIGPEGGFTEDEVSSARAAGYIPCSLGSTVLRVETAAMVATTLLRTAGLEDGRS